MDLTNFLKTGTYLKLKVGLSEENIYSCFKKKDLSKKYYYNKLDKMKDSLISMVMVHLK